jgi:hypothetical protein
MKRAFLAFALVLAAPAGAKKKLPPHKPPPAAAPVAPAPVAEPEAAPAAAEPAPAVAPAPAPPPPVAPAPAPVAAPSGGGDLEALRAEYDAIRDELFRSRARIGVIGQAAFKTKLLVEIDYKAQRDWPLKHVALLLDDKQVYAEENPQAGKPLRAYESFAGAGRHVLSVQLEAVGPDNRVGFGTTGVFFVDVTEGKTVHVVVTADETGDGPSSLAKKHAGSYDVRLRADVKLEALQ